MAERSADFYFDYVSPYAYLAWARIGPLVARHQCALRAVPVLFAGLLTAQGNLGPAEIPAKRRYIFRNAQRLARDVGLPFRCPPTHPFNPLLPLRITIAVDEPAARARLITALLDTLWGQGRAIDTPEAITAVLDDLGLPAAALLQRCAEPALKARLRANTDAAVAQGVFGVPTVVIDQALFWGVDALGHLDHYLGAGDQLDDTEMQRWQEVPGTASRKPADLKKISLLRS